MPCEGLRAAGLVGGRLWGLAFHCCEGRLVSGAVRPPGRPSLGAGSQGSVTRLSRAWGAGGVGVGTQHRPHSVRSCEPALRAVGVAGGRPRGGVPRAVVTGRLGLRARPSLAAGPWGGQLGPIAHLM